MGGTSQIMLAMIIYMALVIIIGVVFAKRANKNSGEFFLGGRSLGPWVAADGSARCGILVRHFRCGMDCYRLGCRYVSELAGCFQAAALL